MIIMQQSLSQEDCYRLICSLCGKKTVEMSKAYIDETLGVGHRIKCGCEKKDDHHED